MLSKKINSALGLVTVMGVFLVVILINGNGNQKLEEGSAQLSSQRGIASAMVVNQNFNDSQWKKRIAMQIAETNHLPSAKTARPPNPVENLIFGELKGFYLMKLDGDKVHSMILNAQMNNQDKEDEIPKYFGEEMSFLKKNRSLWTVDFQAVELKKRETDHSVVSLIDGYRNEVGTAEFSWDSMGHMTALKIEKK